MLYFDYFIMRQVLQQRSDTYKVKNDQEKCIKKVFTRKIFENFLFRKFSNKVMKTFGMVAISGLIFTLKINNILTPFKNREQEILLANFFRIFNLSTYEVTLYKSKKQVSLKGNFVRPDVEGFYERNSDRPLYAEEDTSIWSVFDIIFKFMPGLFGKPYF